MMQSPGVRIELVDRSADYGVPNAPGACCTSIRSPSGFRH
jgi:hypothetical protein